jgi:hypothetical protein
VSVENVPHEWFDESCTMRDIEPLSFGRGEENSFVAAYRRLLARCRRDLPYWYLMAVSGAAFRLQIHRNSWRVISPDLICGYDLAEPLFNACGVTCDRIWVCGNNARIADARNRVIRSLRDGLPVIGLGMEGRTYHGLVVGLTFDVKLLALDYSVPGQLHEVLEKLVWCYHVPSGFAEMPPRLAQIKQAFRLALELTTTARRRSFHLGLDAYDYWYSTLSNPEHHDPYADDWRVRERNEGNFWIYANLVEARRCAAQFCTSVADELPECATPARALADIYSSVVSELEPLLQRKVVRRDRDISVARPWTMHDRRKQAKLLRAARGLEERAVPLLEETLALLDERVEEKHSHLSKEP